MLLPLLFKQLPWPGRCHAAACQQCLLRGPHAAAARAAICHADAAPTCALPRRLCTDGQAPAILESSANGQCQYAPCGATNAAAAAAPALLLTVLVVAMVELLLNFC